MFSVRLVLTNSGIGFSVQSAQRLYNAILLIFQAVDFQWSSVQFQMRKRECSDSFSSVMSE
jgi:hypothetical protein